MVRDENLSGLFDLVEGELTSGPRKEFVKDKNFSDIFSDDWQNNLLESKSPCSPVGWRGFMIDSGSIWFNKDKDKNKWFIFSMLGAKKENITEKKIIDFCKKYLAGFKLPKKVIFMKLPRTSTGKIKKFDLRKIAEKKNEEI